MQKKIKRLSISAELGGLMCFMPGEMMEQRITIKNNGQVWWTGVRNPTEKEIAAGILRYNKVKTSEYKNIGKENAVRLLEKAQAILPSKITAGKQYICDATPDWICIEYEDGEVLSGESVDFSLPNFYEEIAEQVLIENLLFCENYDE